MKRLLLPIFASLIVGGMSDPARAGANCFAEYTVTNGEASETFQARRFISNTSQLAADKINQCSAWATDYIQSVDFVTWKDTKGMCGTLVATGVVWLQMFPERIELAARQVDIACPVVN